MVCGGSGTDQTTTSPTAPGGTAGCVNYCKSSPPIDTGRGNKKSGSSTGRPGGCRNLVDTCPGATPRFVKNAPVAPAAPKGDTYFGFTPDCGLPQVLPNGMCTTGSVLVSAVSAWNSGYETVGDASSNAARTLGDPRASAAEKSDAARYLGMLRNDPYVRTVSTIGRSPVVGAISRITLVVGVGFTAISNYQSTDSVPLATVETVADTAVILGAAKAGGVGGAWVGGAVAGPPGAFVGGFVGGVGGAAAGLVTTGKVNGWIKGGYDRLFK